MLGALRALKPHKAAGPDDVPVEILQLADKGDDAKTNTFGLALLRACNAVFSGDMQLDGRMFEAEFATTLASWHTVRLRPMAKKGGDATLTGAYRGIGIQSAVARLLAMLVLRRLAPAVEHANLLSRGQSGVRSREEAVAQVATLLEVCQRRCSKRMSTYLLFVDFATAYDSVPHDVLLRKLDCLGVRGQLHRLVQRCLALNHAQTMVGATSGERFSVRRGLIQGCPLSPLLFNLFINDLFSDTTGVSVPGLDGTRVADLKYADDVVALARSHSSLQRRLVSLSRWAVANSMRVGARKCAVMVVGSTEGSTARRHARLEAAADRWCVADNACAGESSRIPVASSYRYLGVMFNNQLSVQAMAVAREEAARKVFNMMRPSLCDRRLPLAERVTLAKAFVVPVVLYSAELWAGNVKVTHPLEKLLNDVWCAVLGVRRTASLFCVRRSVQCKSVRSASLIASARALAKWRASRTWMGVLLRAPAFPKRSVWSWKAADALKRADPTRAALTAARDGNVTDAKRVTAAAVTRSENKDDCLAAGHWRDYRLSDTVTEARKLSLSGVRDLTPWMVCQLTRMRVGVFSTYRKLAESKLVDQHWRSHCPFCNAQVPEDLPHFLLECPAWAQQRAAYIHPILRRSKTFAWLGQQARRTDLTYILLGGAVGPHRALSLARMDKTDKKAQRGGVHGAAVAVPAAAAPAPALAAAAAAAPAPAVRAAAAAGAAHAANLPAPVPAPVPPVPVPQQPFHVPLDVPGHVAPPRPQSAILLRSSGLNWMVGVGRYLRAVWSDRTARGPPLSQGRNRGRAELDAPGGGGGG